jgi:hypothetical protein
MMPLTEDDTVNTNGYDAAEANGHGVADANGQDAAPITLPSTMAPPEDEAVNTAAHSAIDATTNTGDDAAEVNGQHAPPTKHVSQSRYRHTTNTRQPNGDTILRKPTPNGNHVELAHQAVPSHEHTTTSSHQPNGGSTPRKQVSFENVGHKHIIPEFASFNARDGFGTNGSELRPPSDVERRAARRNLLHRFLLDVLIYMYDVGISDLRRAVIDCWPVPDTYMHFGGHTSLLTSKEWNQLHEESEDLYKACENVHQGNHSLLTRADQAFVVECVIRPAHDLGVDPTYACEQLLSYRLHRCRAENRKSTPPYAKASLWSRTLGKRSKAQKLLASQLVSDDIAVAQLGTDSYEPLRLLLGRSIRQFDQRHCKLGMGKVPREVYKGPKSSALVLEIQWREAIRARQEKQGKQTSDHEQDTLSSRLPSHTTAPWLGLRQPPKSQSSSSLRSRAIHSIPEEVPIRPQSTSGLRSSRVPHRSASLPPGAELSGYQANSRSVFNHYGPLGPRI